MTRITKGTKGWTQVGEATVLDGKSLVIVQLAMRLAEQQPTAHIVGSGGFSIDLIGDGSSGTFTVYKKDNPLDSVGGREFPPSP